MAFEYFSMVLFRVKIVLIVLTRCMRMPLIIRLCSGHADCWRDCIMHFRNKHTLERGRNRTRSLFMEPGAKEWLPACD